jgi:hypothetical protein
MRVTTMIITTVMTTITIIRIPTHAQGLIFQPAQAASLSLRQPVILSARKVEKQEEYRDAHELAHARDMSAALTAQR